MALFFAVIGLILSIYCMIWWHHTARDVAATAEHTKQLLALAKKWDKRLEEERQDYEFFIKAGEDTKH